MCEHLSMLSESAQLFGGPLDGTQTMVMASPRAITRDGHRYVRAGRIDDFTLRFEWEPPISTDAAR